jgi:UDP-N-acetylmuramate dehydrogenase
VPSGPSARPARVVFSFSVTELAIRTNEPLKPWTTFKIGGPARFFAEARKPEEYRQALAFAAGRRLPIFILGGGSNILVSDRGFDGLVIHPAGKGVLQEAAGAGGTRFRASAGETWDGVVRLAVESGLWGIENLSHIPGQAGAALVQNIGAYGQQIGDVLESAEVMEIESGAVRALSAFECGLAYRRSIFNSTARNHFIILSLTLRLEKHGEPNLGYPDVGAWFRERGVERPAIKEIRDAIIQIRDRKFPFPREEKGGNAGSFFKNLHLSEDEFQHLRATAGQSMQSAEVDRLEQIHSRSPRAGSIKVPTAFLMDICGLKGYRAGGAQVNDAQPLVLLNQGGATAADVVAIAAHVRRTIHTRTGMTIDLEPELVGFDAREIEEILKLEP